MTFMVLIIFFYSNQSLLHVLLFINAQLDVELNQFLGCHYPPTFGYIFLCAFCYFWRKRSMSTHSERSNPPTCEQKIGLKSTEKTEHIRSISPKTLKIARKKRSIAVHLLHHLLLEPRNRPENGALPFSLGNASRWQQDVCDRKTEHVRSQILLNDNPLKENGALPFTFQFSFPILYVESNLTYNIQPWQERQKK